MKITIRTMKLENFKGVKSLELNLEREANIYGDNGTGKTTVFDAFVWLLFGKDSTDRTQFEIKTLDKDNKVIPKIDHSVEAVLDVDGKEVKLSRTFKEKWVTQRGSKEPVFKGHETLYEWNDVPMKAVDYNKKISEIIDEKVFKLITSPYAFNSLKWQEQRETLINISGNVTNESVAADADEYKELLKELDGKSLDEYKAQIKSQISKSKKEIKSIPDRIDEVNRSKPEALDFSSLESELKIKEDELKKVEDKIEDLGQFYDDNLKRRKELKDRISEHENKMITERTNLKHQAQRSYNDLSLKLKDYKNDRSNTHHKLRRSQEQLDKCLTDIKELEGKVKDYDEKLKNLREDYKAKANEEVPLDEDSLKCPTCKRPFEGDDLEERRSEIKGELNRQRSSELARINKEGISLKKQREREQQYLEEQAKRKISLEESIEDTKAQLKMTDDLIEEIQHKIDNSSDDWVTEFNSLVENSKEIKEQETEIEELNKEIEELQKAYNASSDDQLKELRSKKQDLKAEIEKIKQDLHREKEIDKADRRIDELKDEESKLSEIIADHEAKQYTIECFEKDKMNKLEELINERFEIVRFKLFKEQINGGEDPTCVALIDGVPFQDANTASRINAGIDIINTLSSHYSVNAPIFIDNRESVVNVIDTASQLINLIVSEDDKKLRVA